MKPYQETWTQQIGDGAFELFLEDGGRIAFVEGGNAGTDEARAQLAAQAPALARWMLGFLSMTMDPATAAFWKSEREEVERILSEAGVIP